MHTPPQHASLQSRPNSMVERRCCMHSSGRHENLRRKPWEFKAVRLTLRRAAYGFERSIRVDVKARSPTSILLVTLQGAAAVPEDVQWMEEVIDFHARRLLQLSADLPTSQKYLVGIAGSPGSGKSTTAEAVARCINASEPRSQRTVPFAVVASMDGYHYYRHQLDAMEDPEQAHARRGAHWTFDATAFVEAMRQLRREGQAKLPSFDHAVGDPVEDDVVIHPDHKIVIIEGNYVLLDEEPWGELADLFDESWFIQCSIDVAMDRVLARQVGNGSSPETACWRVQNNDRPNAELIQTSMARADIIIPDLPYGAVSNAQ